MDLSSFTPAQRRHVVRAQRGYQAFVPPPLPPTIVMEPRLSRRLSSADRALGELAGVGRVLPDPEMLSRTLARREAVLSSRIEGTLASLSDLVLFELDEPRDHEHDDVREVHNYLTAMNHALDPNRRLPLSLGLLREVHGLLLTDVRGGYATPGEFRRTQNWIGPSGATIKTARYVPPPPELLWDSLDGFEKHFYAEHDLPPLLTIAALHYQFEAIRPFLDGNGRVGRLLVVLLLIEWGLLPAPLLDLSAYVEPRRQIYYDSLLRVSAEGDWLGWFLFFLDVVEHQATDARERAVRLQALRNDLRRRVATARSSGLLALLVDALMGAPALTIGRAQKILGVTHRAATLNIEKLIALGILEELDTAGRRRVFLSREVLAVVND